MPGGFWSRVISYSNGYPEDDDPHQSTHSTTFQHQTTYPRSHPSLPDPAEFNPFSGQSGYSNEPHGSYDPSGFDPPVSHGGDKLEFKYEGPVQLFQQRSDPLAIHDASSYQSPVPEVPLMNGGVPSTEYAMNSTHVMSAVSPFEDDLKPGPQSKSQQYSWYLNNHQSIGDNLDYNRNYWQPQLQSHPQQHHAGDVGMKSNVYQETLISPEFAQEQHHKSSEEPLNLSALPNLNQAHGSLPYRHHQSMAHSDPSHLSNEYYDSVPKFSSNPQPDSNSHLQLRNKHFLSPYGDEHERHLVTPGLGHSSKMVPPSNHNKGPKEKTMQYMLRRERNNIAVRKSREKAKRSFEELVRKEKFLKERNASLELKLAKLSRNVMKLRGYYRSLKEAGMIN